MTTRELATDTLAAEIGRVLLSDDPDASRLAHRLVRRATLSQADADRLIYHVAAELNARFFPPITKVELILTEGCNLACAYCFERPMRGARKMSPAVARAAIDLLVDYSGEEKTLDVTHFGGEPLLNFSTLAATTEYAEERAAATGKSIEFNVTTNGLLLDECIADYLAQHGIKALLSIDGTAPSHDRYRRDRRRRGTFDRSMASLKLLKTRQPWIGAKMTVMPENAARLFDDVRDLHDLGVNQFLIGHATGVPWPAEDIAVYGEEMRRLHDWYRQTSRDAVRITEFDDGANAPPHFGCQAGRDSLSISVTGEISSCSKVLALNNKQLIAKLGDVRYGLTHLANRAQFVSCARLRTACEALGIAADYGGGCLAVNYEESGDLFQPSLQDRAFSLLKRAARRSGPASPESVTTLEGRP
jgi:uncharacterized protein